MDCIEIFMLYQICVNKCYIFKIGREYVKGKVVKVSPMAVLLDDKFLVRISRIYWVKEVECSEV